MAKTMTDAKTTLDALTQRSDTCLTRKVPKRRERVKTPGGVSYLALSEHTPDRVRRRPRYRLDMERVSLSPQWRVHASQRAQTQGGGANMLQQSTRTSGSLQAGRDSNDNGKTNQQSRSQRAQQSQRACVETQRNHCDHRGPSRPVQCNQLRFQPPSRQVQSGSAAQPITVTPTNSIASGPKREETQATARYRKLCNTVDEPAKIARTVTDAKETATTYGPGEVTRTPLPDIHRVSYSS